MLWEASMRLELLGTAVEEGFPEPFCRCQNCEAPLSEGGRSLRLRSSAIINDDLVIDLGPDVQAVLLRRGSRLGRFDTRSRRIPQRSSRTDHVVCKKKGLAGRRRAADGLLLQLAIVEMRQTFADHLPEATAAAQRFAERIPAAPWSWPATGSDRHQT
jgi:hypothetical protein